MTAVLTTILVGILHEMAISLYAALRPATVKVLPTLSVGSKSSKTVNVSRITDFPNIIYSTHLVGVQTCRSIGCQLVGKLRGRYCPTAWSQGYQGLDSEV